MFELRTEPAPQGLASLGQVVELHELCYGAMRDAMAAGVGAESADRLLAASLHVDGEPVGYDALQALPGRFAGSIARALEQTLRLHGLGQQGQDEGDDAPNA